MLVEIRTRQPASSKVGEGTGQRSPGERGCAKGVGDIETEARHGAGRASGAAGGGPGWRWADGGREAGDPEEGSVWARPAGWVVRVGLGKDDRAGFSGPGQLGGRRGWVHIKGEDPWQLAWPLPARPSWASLSLFDVCGGVVDHGAHRLSGLGVRGAVWLSRWGRAQAGGLALEGRQGRLQEYAWATRMAVSLRPSRPEQLGPGSAPARCPDLNTEGSPRCLPSHSTSGCWSCPGGWWAWEKPATPPSRPPS